MQPRHGKKEIYGEDLNTKYIKFRLPATLGWKAKIY